MYVYIYSRGRAGRYTIYFLLELLSCARGGVNSGIMAGPLLGTLFVLVDG